MTNGEPILGACADSVLIRPTSGSAPYRVETPLQPSYCTLSLLFSDWGRTGRRDLRVSNDRHYYSDYSDGQEQLWRMSPGAEPTQYTRDDGWQRLRIEGMGIASQDVTGDGLPEVYLTSQAENRLETLAAGADRPDYRNTAYQSGVESAQPSTGGDHMPSTAWHPQFEDVNADGLMDLFLTKGNVTADPQFAMRRSERAVPRPGRWHVPGRDRKDRASWTWPARGAPLSRTSTSTGCWNPGRRGT